MRLLPFFVFWLDATGLELQELAEMLEMMDLKKFLGGNVEVDSWFPLYKYPSLLGQYKLTYSCDLICDSFDALGTLPCRWRNEWTVCGSGDELDWVRACGRWGDSQADEIFNTDKRPEGHFLLCGSQKKLPAEHSAMLVSDPIQCQHGDGFLTFNHWTSPRVRLRVCVRHPGSGKIYMWCSSDILSQNPGGPTTVTIPGSIMGTFEIVIEAYNFVFDNFGKKGGIAVIDTISYNAQAIYNCHFLPHFDPPVPFDKETCEKLTCDFDERICTEPESTDFDIGYNHVGSHHAGVRRPLRGDFAFAKGPSSSSLEFGPLNLTRASLLEFCFYRSTVYPRIAVILAQDEENETTIFENAESYVVHSWQCQQLALPPGMFESLIFKLTRMRNIYTTVAFDEIRLLDPLTMKPCISSFRPDLHKLQENQNQSLTSTLDNNG